MRKAFMISSGLLLTAYALQFVFAAMGGFTKPAGDDAYTLHSVNGMAVIPALSLLTVLFAALAKAPGRLVGLATLPLGLVVLQPVLAMLANGSADATGASTPLGLVIGGLHALNGIVAVHVVAAVMRGVGRLSSDAPAAVREEAPA
ncbi:DUF6220 domain-containing protein [Micromonospora sp. WMMD1120]|uniref:DUF6220 domain-containing protein n=1 Tax=Micromonospora sp. WMMD1120 TaxID=3016106 RepID=UPI0024159745|nr:DUF6220 domain-containing protein [Micromonospora sp. WMMD1120]MDG4809578.1 DUF6220 domain-containing protein [Micromonospora sp. WMMD1120]